MIWKFILLSCVYILGSFHAIAQTIEIKPAENQEQIKKIIGASVLTDLKPGEEQYNLITPLAIYLIDNDPILFIRFIDAFNHNFNQTLAINLIKLSSQQAPTEPACVESQTIASIINKKFTITNETAFSELDLEQQIYFLAKASLYQTLTELLGDIGESEIMAITELILDLESPSEIYELLKLYQHEKTAKDFLNELILSQARKGNYDLSKLKSFTAFWGTNLNPQIELTFLKDHAFQLDDKTMNYLIQNKLISTENPNEMTKFLIDNRMFENLAQYFNEVAINLESFPNSIENMIREYYVGLKQDEARLILLKQLKTHPSLSAYNYTKLRNAAEGKKDHEFITILDELAKSTTQIERTKSEIKIERNLYCTSAVLLKEGYSYFDQEISFTDNEIQTVDAFQLEAKKTIAIKIPQKGNDKKRFWLYEASLTVPMQHEAVRSYPLKKTSLALNKVEFYHKSLTKPLTTFEIDQSQIMQEYDYQRKNLSILYYFDSSKQKPKDGVILLNYFCTPKKEYLDQYKEAMSALGKIIVETNQSTGKK